MISDLDMDVYYFSRNIQHPISFDLNLNIICVLPIQGCILHQNR